MKGSGRKVNRVVDVEANKGGVAQREVRVGDVRVGGLRG